MTKNNNLAYILLVLTTLFWSGNFIVGKAASMFDIPPFSLNFYRWFFAGIILLPFTLKEIIQKKNYDNVYYSFGHHHLGWTLGAISGKIVTKIIDNENTNMDLQPYSSTRFS